MKVTPAMNIIRALVFGDKQAARMAELTGLAPRQIFRADKGYRDLSRWRMRPGEALAIFDLRAFGETRAEWIAGMKHVTGAGAVLVEVESGLVCRDASGAEFIVSTERRALGERIMPPGKAKRMVEKKIAALHKDRMPKTAARAIWRNTRDYPTEAGALAKMSGWNHTSAHRAFGKRKTKPGPRPKK
jgi:hypothetical protein